MGDEEERFFVTTSARNVGAVAEIAFALGTVGMSKAMGRSASLQ